MRIDAAEAVLLDGFNLTGFNSPTYAQLITTEGYVGGGFTVTIKPYSLSDVLVSATVSSIGEYFPRWMNLYYDDYSLLKGFLKFGGQRDLVTASFYHQSLKDFLRFNPWLGQLRQGWIVNTNIPPNEIRTLTVTFFNPNDSATETTTIRRCSSEFDFLNSLDPCYYAFGATVYVRNLQLEYYFNTIAGDVTISPDTLIKEEDILINLNEVWTRIQSGDSRINYNTNVISTGISGAAVMVYPSGNRANAMKTATASINDGPAIALSSFDFWNELDEIGLLLYTPRFTGEVNGDYWVRLKSIFRFPGGAREESLTKGIARETNLLHTGYWDTTSPISLPTSGNTIFSTLVRDKEYKSLERLKKFGSYYYGSKDNWVHPYVLVDGYATLSLPISGNKVLFSGNDLLGGFTYYNYTKSASAGMDILTPTRNLPIEPIDLAWVSKIRVNTLTKASYLNNLINGDKTYTTALVNITQDIKTQVPVSFGYGKWNRVNWFENGEVTPEVNFLPTGMDD